MTIKFRLVKGNVFGLPSGTVDKASTRRNIGSRRPGGPYAYHANVIGHIERIDTGRIYEGLGLKDLQRRLDYWETRVANFAAMAAEAEGEAKKKAAKVLKDGEKLLNRIRSEIEERSAA